MPIPRIIHQTNGTKELSDIYKSYQNRVIEIHPDWEYRFYDDIECRNTVEQYFPYLLPIMLIIKPISNFIANTYLLQKYVV